MPHAPEPAQVASRRSYLAVAILIAAGYGLTLVFYPGVMTYDAKFVYGGISERTLGDWQSPAMTVLWALIDPIAPGSGSMFLLIATTYWVGFGLLAFTIARRSVWLAVLVPILALTPPGLHLRRHDLARHAVHDVLAARRCHGFRGSRLRREAASDGAGGGDRAVRVRCLVAPECADRGADPRRLHCVANSVLLEATADDLRAGHGSILCADPARLLRRAGSRGSIHCKRSWCSTSAVSATSPGRTSFLLPGVHPSRRSFGTVATDRRSGTSTGGSSRANSSCTSSKGTKNYSARLQFKMPGLTPSFATPSPILNTAPASCGISSRDQI